MFKAKNLIFLSIFVLLVGCSGGDDDSINAVEVTISSSNEEPNYNETSESLINILHQIENLFGRKRNKQNESRTLDLDIIDYNGIIKTDYPILPHPRMHQRMFVLKPLCDINPKWVHPVFKEKALNLLKKLANQKILNIN